MEEKLQIDVYKGLPMVLEKIKLVALAAVMGKPYDWAHQRANKYLVNGKPRVFVEEDMPTLNKGIEVLGDEILQSLVNYTTDRDEVISQVKSLSNLISMPYIYLDVLKVKKTWFDSRMKARSKEGKACSFKEDDILRINMAAMQIANELKSIEFVLK